MSMSTRLMGESSALGLPHKGYSLITSYDLPGTYQGSMLAEEDGLAQIVDESIRDNNGRERSAGRSVIRKLLPLQRIGRQQRHSFSETHLLPEQTE